MGDKMNFKKVWEKTIQVLVGISAVLFFAWIIKILITSIF